MSAHASHQGSHQLETFRLPTRNERPSGYEQTNGWGRVSNMQSRRTHSSKASWPPAQGSCTLALLDRAQSCATKQSRHTTPHHTRPHHITHDTTPRFVAFAAQRQGQRQWQKDCCWLAQLLCGATTPRLPLLLYCVEASTRALFWPGSWLWLQAMVWSSIRSQPSGRRQPSPTMHVLVLDCAHPLCVRACTRPPYLH